MEIGYRNCAGTLVALGVLLSLSCTRVTVQPLPPDPSSGRSGQTLYDREIRRRAEAPPASMLSAREYFERGQDYERQGNDDEAIAAYGKAIAGDPRLVGARQRRAMIYQRKELYAAAIMDFDQVLAAAPGSAQARYFRGVAHARLDQHERAIEDMSWVIERHEGNPLAYHERGRSYFALGDFDRALSDFDKELSLNSDHQWGYFYRGLTHYSRGNYNSAVVDYTRALLYDPKSVPAYVNRCWALALLGRAERAREDCSKAAVLNPGVPHVYDALAFVFWQLGERDKAFIALERAKALDGEFMAPDERYREFPIMLAQSLLKAAGYDPGTVDGEMGALTRSAIRKFQSDEKLEVSGEVSERLLKRLRATPAARHLHETRVPEPARGK